MLDEARRLGVEVQVSATDALRLGQLNDSLRRHRDQLAGLADPGESLESLRKLRQRLSDEIESLIARGTAALADARSRRSRLVEATAQAQHELGKLGEELAEVERAQHELQTRRAEGVQCKRQDRSATDVELGERLARLRTLEARLERWRDVLGDVAQRRQALQAGSEDPTSTGSAKTGDPRHFLRSLESHLGDLSSLAATLSSDRAECRCGRVREILPATVQAMREDVYRLCRELNGWQMHAQLRECTGELAQLARCEAELEDSLRGLVAQRNGLLEEIAACQPGCAA